MWPQTFSGPLPNYGEGDFPAPLKTLAIALAGLTNFEFAVVVSSKARMKSMMISEDVELRKYNCPVLSRSAPVGQFVGWVEALRADTQRSEDNSDLDSGGSLS